MEEFGPIQILVVGFGEMEFDGTILDELQRLKDRDIVRLVDLVVVAKDADGEVVSVETTDLTPEQSVEFGALAGALIGLGADGEEGMEEGMVAGAEAAVDSDGEFLGDEVMWSIADTIPTGTTAAVALLEHRWAIPFRDAIRDKGGILLADSWLHPADLIAFGASMSDEG